MQFQTKYTHQSPQVKLTWEEILLKKPVIYRLRQGLKI